LIVQQTTQIGNHSILLLPTNPSSSWPQRRLQYVPILVPDGAITHQILQVGGWEFNVASAIPVIQMSKKIKMCPLSMHAWYYMMMVVHVAVVSSDGCCIFFPPHKIWGSIWELPIPRPYGGGSAWVLHVSSPLPARYRQLLRADKDFKLICRS